MKLIEATTIFNRAGTVHFWRPSHSRPETVVRSLCGLVDERRNLDASVTAPYCKNCTAANKRTV